MHIAITNLSPRKMMGFESCGMLLSAVNNLKNLVDEELLIPMVEEHIPMGVKKCHLKFLRIFIKTMYKLVYIEYNKNVTNPDILC